MSQLVYHFEKAPEQLVAINSVLAASSPCSLTSLLPTPSEPILTPTPQPHARDYEIDVSTAVSLYCNLRLSHRTYHRLHSFLPHTFPPQQTVIAHLKEMTMAVATVVVKGVELVYSSLKEAL